MMGSVMSKFKQNQKDYNISITEFHDIVNQISDIFGQANVLIIGGRAVNLYCYNNQRFTNDIDITLKLDEGKDLMDYKEKLFEAGFLYLEKSKASFVACNYNEIKIDFYTADLNKISVNDMMATATTISERRGGTELSFNVISPALLVWNKWVAYNSRKQEGNKDLIDIQNLLEQRYKNDVKRFVRDEKEALDIIAKTVGLEKRNIFLAELQNMLAVNKSRELGDVPNIAAIKRTS
jgi:predicted nucleotidyltransferase component of viral defense system